MLPGEEEISVQGSLKRRAELITCGWRVLFIGGKEGGSVVGWRYKFTFLIERCLYDGINRNKDLRGVRQ